MVRNSPAKQEGPQFINTLEPPVYRREPTGSVRVLPTRYHGAGAEVPDRKTFRHFHVRTPDNRPPAEISPASISGESVREKVFPNCAEDEKVAYTFREIISCSPNLLVLQNGIIRQDSKDYKDNKNKKFFTIVSRLRRIVDISFLSKNENCKQPAKFTIFHYLS